MFPNDLAHRLFTIIGEVQACVRKATVFRKEASLAKSRRELWERADKLGADAVTTL